MMKQRFSNIAAVIVMILAAFSVVSCKKQLPQAQPDGFVPGIDAVAAAPLPQLDLTLARRIIREGPIDPTADRIDDSYDASSPASSTTPLDSGPGPADMSAPAAATTAPAAASPASASSPPYNNNGYNSNGNGYNNAAPEPNSF